MTCPLHLIVRRSQRFTFYMKKRRTPSQAIGTAETNEKKTVAKSGALARIAATHLRRPRITMGRLTIAGASNSGAEAHAPQPSKLRTYSSIPSRDINGSQHTHGKAPGSRSAEYLDINVSPMWSNARLCGRQKWRPLFGRSF